MRKLIVLLFFLLILIGGGLFLTSGVKTTGKGGEFTVREGSTSATVFRDLKEQGYISNDDIAYYYGRFLHTPSFKAGDYEIPAGLNLPDLIDYLSDSNHILVDTVTITFKEGQWLKHYARALSENTQLNEADILAYWDDPEVVRSYIDRYEFLTEDILNADVRHPLEGYLFPDTYTFYRDTTIEEATEKMLEQTDLVYQELKRDVANAPYDIHEIFTLASIVQYEAASVQDMRSIASVFLNRLSINMPLQSSVTVCYAIDLSDDQDWKACEFNSSDPSPYNTYQYAGLPPGPILNPGKDALKAVLEPEENDYLFFIADVCGDGQVYYAKDFAEHQANVEKYLTCY